MTKIISTSKMARSTTTTGRRMTGVAGVGVSGKCILWVALLGLAMLSPTSVVTAKAILGVDLGSLYMKVALVQRGAPLEIVTNFHSKRKTEQVILLDSGSRFYGADAYSLLARKPMKTPTAMTLLLGRSDEHPAVKVLVDRYHSILPTYNETRHGLMLKVEGSEHDFTPEELVAMILEHAKEITTAYGTSKGSTYGTIRDVVLTVPSFATQAERLAWLDAAHLADLNVLALLDENTAAALHFGMDKLYTNTSQLILFYNMGASSLQVSLVKYDTYEIPESKLSKKTKTVGALQVLAKAWDMTLGGDAFDHRLVEHMADLFNHQWHKTSGSSKNQDGTTKDVRTDTRAMMKLRLQASKVKHVLSANTEVPVFVESLHEDIPFSTHMTRHQLEDLCADLIKRAVTPIHSVLKQANVTIAELNGLELIGGGMRIPKIQASLEETLKIELGMHINSDESMALGAAFHGANISTAFRVRHVGMTDIYPFAIAIQLNNLPPSNETGIGEGAGLFGLGKKKVEKATAAPKDGEDDDTKWSKGAAMFKANSKVGVKKTIAFTHNRDVSCAIDYEPSDTLPEGTQLYIARYNITGLSGFAQEMAAKGLGKPKVSLQFELSQSGITRLVKAEAAIEETVIIQEEVVVKDDEANDNATSASNDTTARQAKEAEAKKTNKPTDEAKTDSSAKENLTESNETATSGQNSTSNETNVEPKPKKTILVDKMFGIRPPSPAFLTSKEVKRVHRRLLTVTPYYIGKIQPYSTQLLLESKSKLQAIERKDRERVLLEEARNKVESYIYHIKNKLVDNEEAIAKVSTEEQRAEISKLADDAEEWMYDEGAKANLTVMVDKYAELSTPAEKIFLRVAEMTARPEAILALQAKLTKIEELMTKWETTMPQVTKEERQDVLEKVANVRKWIAEKEEAQANVAATEEPVFLSSEVAIQSKPAEALVTRLSRKPKPKPKKNATKAENGNATKSADANTTNTSTSESKSEKEATTGTDETKAQEQKTETTTVEDEL